MKWEPINPNTFTVREGFCTVSGIIGPRVSVTRDSGNDRWWCHASTSGGVFSAEQNPEALKRVALENAVVQFESALTMARDALAEVLATADNLGVPVSVSDAAAREV